MNLSEIEDEMRVEMMILDRAEFQTCANDIGCRTSVCVSRLASAHHRIGLVIVRALRIDIATTVVDEASIWKSDQPESCC